ncbi:ligase-associated DNA damage response endonuclease PdeM [Aquimarina sp. D1M17]|uniref:ligase-associated DNA damage response endonuclease PdeM n=1 Tax=Aquimarina acroporae TaxID=2937283 RepID=UPI0020C064FF|nr:ligase-associated DNA damage response endonuclease PdeM [Aquimarina acroporae]MCK8521367.1 ligase-associated DNA damage response endonuclease PdeM [Aquimarina acroporae]
MTKTKTTYCYRQTFELHPSGGVYWHEFNMLLIADVHLGKVTHFRKYGSAVPQGAITQNFDKLDQVILYFKPAVICFLGDLFHSYVNQEWNMFSNWIQTVEAKIVLISGNHDVISPVKYEELNIHISDEWSLGSVLLTHHPESREGMFNISGHIHPGVRLKGEGKQSLTVPCFFKQTHQMILPAFGVFTGKHILNPKLEDEVFVITEDEVIQIP